MSGQYGAEDYWDRRYGERACNFEWFFSYDALGELIKKALGSNRHLPVLHVGCGNSTIQEGMVSDGFASVTNVDISSVVIHQMKARSDTTNEALHYEVVDCRDMHQFADGSFSGVIDKGTLDAVMCSAHGCADTLKYLKEIDRVLCPGGVFLLVTLGAPTARQNVINGPPGANWQTDVLLLPKPECLIASEASLSGRVLEPVAAGTVQSNKDDPPTLMGPYTTEESSKLLHDVRPSRLAHEQHDFFFAYICKKPCGDVPLPAATCEPCDDIVAVTHGVSVLDASLTRMKAPADAHVVPKPPAALITTASNVICTGQV